MQHQPEAGQLSRQRAAQSQRVTRRMAEEALFEAYIEAGLDAEVRQFFRGVPGSGSAAGKKPRRAS